MADRPQFARMLLAVRREHGWTQADLARELCVRRETVADWERGARSPHPGWIARVRMLVPELSGTVDAQLEMLSALQRDVQAGRVGQHDAQRLKEALGNALLALIESSMGSARAA
jgi:transcriptional regulator with XRE-family HTH domain